MTPAELHNAVLGVTLDYPSDVRPEVDFRPLAMILAAYWKSLIGVRPPPDDQLISNATDALWRASSAINKAIAVPLTFADKVGPVAAVVAMPTGNGLADIRAVARSGLVIGFTDGIAPRDLGGFQVSRRLGQADYQGAPIEPPSHGVESPLGYVRDRINGAMGTLAITPTVNVPVTAQYESAVSKRIKKDIHDGARLISKNVLAQPAQVTKIYLSTLNSGALAAARSARGLIADYNRVLGLEDGSRHERAAEFLQQAKQQYPVMGALLGSSTLTSAVVSGASVKKLLHDLAMACAALPAEQAQKAVTAWKKFPAAALTPTAANDFGELSVIFAEIPLEKLPTERVGTETLQIMRRPIGIPEVAQHMNAARVQRVEAMLRAWTMKHSGDELAALGLSPNNFLTVRRDYMGWLVDTASKVMRPASVDQYLERVAKKGPAELMAAHDVFVDRLGGIEAALSELRKVVERDARSETWLPLVKPGELDRVAGVFDGKLLREETTLQQLKEISRDTGLCVGNMSYHVSATSGRNRLFTVRDARGAFSSLMEIWLDAERGFCIAQHQGRVNHGNCRATPEVDREVARELLAALNQSLLTNTGCANVAVINDMRRAQTESVRSVATGTSALGSLLANLENEREAQRFAEVVAPALPVSMPAAFVWAERRALYGEVPALQIPIAVRGPELYDAHDALVMERQLATAERQLALG